LLTKGADPNLQDKDGNTCLHFLAQREYNPIQEQMLQQCLDFGGNIEIANFSSRNCNQMTSNLQNQRLFMEQKMTFTEQVTGGDVEVALSWQNKNDLDLHCRCPCGQDIHFGRKSCNGCKGYLDIDMNVSVSRASNTPVEHIYWPTVPKGRFRIEVEYYSFHCPSGQVKTEFLIVMKVKGDIVFEKMGTALKEDSKYHVLTFEFDDKETFTLIEGKEPTKK